MSAVVSLLLLAAAAQVPAAVTPPSGKAAEQSVASDENPYAATFAAEGTGTDTFVYLHNRRGVRIELNLDKRTLDLWISPRAGRSVEYRDRNFSNRDDHTSIFDRIALPRLERKEFLGCDYDPFHSVLRFKGQTLHLATLFDRPVVLMWFENPSVVDLKTDKQDRFLARSGRVFETEHPDRGLVFRFTATLGPGSGSFAHQRDVDAGRSTWARATMGAKQVLVLAGELADQPVSEWAKEAAETPVERLLADTESKVEAALSAGRVQLRGRPDLQRVLDLNRRVLLSMQDESGAIQAALKFIYYLIWVRDGAIIAAPAAQSGWLDPLARWNAFLLANPTVTEHEPKGRFFGQLVNGRITKWEEDGLFYAAWSAFTYFSQTGNRRFASGQSLAVLHDATDWLERYTFDREKGFFGRYHDGETPLSDSRGDGWDDAVGSPAERFRTEVRGRVVTRSYDLAANLTSWGVYVMLAAMDAERAPEYLAKAHALETRLRPWLARQDALPDYGDLLTREGDLIRVTPSEMGMGDYTWALSLTPFAGEIFDLAPLRARLLEESMAAEKTPFLATRFSLLASLDTEFHDEARILAAIDRVVPEAVRPGRYLPMAGTAPEVAGIEDGHPYHDVRPQAFSVGPWLWAVANLGLRRLPFGLAVRPTSALEGIDAYEYRGALLEVRFEGQGGVERVTLNGEPVHHSLQVPDGRLNPGPNRLVVGLGPKAPTRPLLVSSTVRLESVGPTDAGVAYDVEGFGRDVLIFRGQPTVVVHDGAGRRVPHASRESADHTSIDFQGRGRFRVVAR